MSLEISLYLCYCCHCGSFFLEDSHSEDMVGMMVSQNQEESSLHPEDASLLG